MYPFSCVLWAIFIHPHLFPIVALHHAQVFPAITFVKRGMLRDEVEGADTFYSHILADMFQQMSGNAVATSFRFHL